MQKQMNRVSIIFGFVLFLAALLLPIAQGVQRSYTLLEVWLKSIFSGDFSGFWAANFANLTTLILSSVNLILVLLSLISALLLLKQPRSPILEKTKFVFKIIALFIPVAFLNFYLDISLGFFAFPLISLLESFLLRYYDDKAERDQAYEEARKIELDQRRRIAFPGKYPPEFHQIVRKNFRYYLKNYLLLIFAHALVFFTLLMLIFTYRDFTGMHSQEDLFSKTGLIRILLESGGVLLLLLLLFLSFMDGLYLDFKNRHTELFVLLGIRRKTFLKMLLEEFGFCVLAGLLIGGIAGLIVSRDIVSYLFALLAFVGLMVVGMAIQQEKILRLIQFRPRLQEKADQPNKKWIWLWLIIGTAGFVITLWWFHRRKSAETLLVIMTLAIALLGLFLGGLGLYVQKKREKIDLLLSRNDLFYRFHKSCNVLILMTLLQVLIAGFFLPRLAAFQINDSDTSFPYNAVAKVKPPEVQKVEKKLNQHKDPWASYPMIRVTSVDGDSDFETWGVARPVMMIQGQHIGISEATYQKLRKAIKLPQKNLNLKPGEWHVVYQQTRAIRAQPIDWDAGSPRPRLRIGQPLENYNTANVDRIFPMRKIKSQERLILTGMFHRGLQENIIVLNDQDFADKTKKKLPDQLFLIHGSGKSLRFLAETYKAEKRWDDTIHPLYEKNQRQKNVETEDHLQILLLIFTLLICWLIGITLIVAKFESDEPRIIARQRLLDQLVMRQKEQRTLLKKHIGLFVGLPIVLGLLFGSGFIIEMGMLRFFSGSEWLHFGRIYLLDYAVYLLGWTVAANLLYRRIEKWR